MNDNDERLMKEFGISAEAKTVFHYDGHRYERLADAITYAKARRSADEGLEPSQAPTAARKIPPK